MTRKISLAAAKAKQNKSTEKIKLGNSAAVRDWGYAPEYVESMWLMMQHNEPLDLVIATGKEASVRDFAEKAFSHVGLDANDYIEFDSSSELRPLEVDVLIGNSALAKQVINWTPSTFWMELAEILVDFDMEPVI